MISIHTPKEAPKRNRSFFGYFVISFLFLLSSCQEKEQSVFFNYQDGEVFSQTEDYHFSLVEDELSIILPSGNETKLRFATAFDKGILQNEQKSILLSDKDASFDLRLYSKDQKNVAYDLILKPGVDPSAVKMNMEQHSDINLDDVGNLYITMGEAVLQHTAPVSYQIINGERVDVPSKYKIDGDQVGFELGEYDPAYSVVIDPEIRLLAEDLMFDCMVPADPDFCDAIPTNDIDFLLQPSNNTIASSLSWNEGSTVDPQKVGENGPQQNIAIIGDPCYGPDKNIVRVSTSANTSSEGNLNLTINSNSKVYVENATLIVTGNLELTDAGSVFAMKNGRLFVQGNYDIQTNGAQSCITGSVVHIGEQSTPDGVDFMPEEDDPESGSNYDNQKGENFFRDVCLNVTENYSIQSDSQGDTWVNVCAEIGDRDGSDADAFTADGNDSGNFQNSEIFKAYGSDLFIANGGFDNQSDSYMLLCDFDVATTKKQGSGSGNGNVNNSGDIEGEDICVISVDDILTQSGSSWTSGSIRAWYSTTANSFAPATVGESTMQEVIDDEDCFTADCCASAGDGCDLMVDVEDPADCGQDVGDGEVSFTLTWTVDWGDEECCEMIDVAVKDAGGVTRYMTSILPCSEAGTTKSYSEVIMVEAGTTGKIVIGQGDCSTEVEFTAPDACEEECPDLTGLSIMTSPVCENETFTVTVDHTMNPGDIELLYGDPGKDPMEVYNGTGLMLLATLTPTNIMVTQTTSEDLMLDVDTYTIYARLKDADAECDDIASAELTVNPEPEISAPDLCIGDTEEITIALGTPAAMNPFATTRPDLIEITEGTGGDAGKYFITGLAEGMAPITFTDDKGCTTMISVNVNAGPEIDLEIICGEGDNTGLYEVSWGFTPTQTPANTGISVDFESFGPFATLGPNYGGDKYILSTDHSLQITFTDNATGCTTVEFVEPPTCDPDCPDIISIEVAPNGECDKYDITISHTAWETSFGPLRVRKHTGNGDAGDFYSSQILGNDLVEEIIPSPGSTSTVIEDVMIADPGEGTDCFLDVGLDIVALDENSQPIPTVYSAGDEGCAPYAITPIAFPAKPTLSGANLCIGESAMLTFMGTPADTDPFTSSDDGIVSVDYDADMGTVTVTREGIGAATITFTDINGCETTADITEVDCPDPCELSIDEIILTPCEEGTQDAQVTFSYADGPEGNILVYVNGVMQTSIGPNGSGQETITLEDIDCSGEGVSIELAYANDMDCGDVKDWIPGGPIDPQGYIYCEETGEIITGGLLTVMGPMNGSVFQLDLDGSSGEYAFQLLSGAGGTFMLSYEPPVDGPYALSTDHTEMAGPLDLSAIDNDGDLDMDPTLDNVILGLLDGDDSGFLDNYDFSTYMDDNPFFLKIVCVDGDPDLMGNNIPLSGCCVYEDPGALMVTVENECEGIAPTVMLTAEMLGENEYAVGDGFYFVHYTLDGVADAAEVAFVNGYTEFKLPDDLEDGFYTLVITGISISEECNEGELDFTATFMVGCDLGDLPEQGSGDYNTTLDENGPKHQILFDENDNVLLRLGAEIDGEADGQPDGMALGDDNGDTDDEDGVRFLTPIIPGNSAMIEVTVYNNSGSDAFLYGFMDFNGDNNPESVTLFTNSTTFASTGSAVTRIYTILVPTNATFSPGGALFSRFRLSTDSGLGAGGMASDGEVEDYKEALAKIGNLVFHDYNFNGIQDAGEPGIPGVQVTLTWLGEDVDNPIDDEGYAVISTASSESSDASTTTSEGEYYFCGLIAGTYKLTFITPTNMTPTRTDQGADDRRDSDGVIMVNPMNLTLVMDTFEIEDVTDLPEDESGLFDDANGDDGMVGNFPDNQVDESFDQGFAFLDYGDLPDDPDNDDDYATLMEEGGAVHSIFPGLLLGPTIDAERDGNPSDNADGDDNSDTGSSGGDEDGVEFITPLIPGEEACVRVTASYSTSGLSNAVLEGWIDWNGDGKLDDSERLTSAEGHANSSFEGGDINISATGDLVNHLVCFDVPENANFNAGMVMARFRLSENGGTGPNGPDKYQEATNFELPLGEVEDYKVNLAKVGNLVWEDYNNNGIQDTGEPGIEGASVSLTWFGATTITYGPILTDANGRYYFCGLIGGGDSYKITVTTPDGMTPSIYTGLNFDGNDNNDNDGIVDGSDLTMTMSDYFTINDPTNLVTNEDGTQDAGSAGVGTFPDEQVDERYDFGFVSIDYGDLPDSYMTSADMGGPSHLIQVGKYLGSCVDGERDGQPDETAGFKDDGNGDDNNAGFSGEGTCEEAGDDEDGIEFLTPLIPGHEACIEVTYTVEDLNNRDGAFLDAWIDFNGDGDFFIDNNPNLGYDPNEHVVFNKKDGAAITPASHLALANGTDVTLQLCFDVPENAAFYNGAASARFRLNCETDPNNVTPKHRLIGGEVEDYMIPLGKIGNFVWNDLNRNGFQDLGEPGINGVSVRLTWAGPDGDLDMTDDNVSYNDILTGSVSPTLGQLEDGEYYFCGLTPGTYKITVFTPNNLTPSPVKTTGIGTNIINSDGVVFDNDFNMVMTNPIIIKDVTALTENENGIEDSGSNGVGNYPDNQVDESYDFGFFDGNDCACKNGVNVVLNEDCQFVLSLGIVQVGDCERGGFEVVVNDKTPGDNIISSPGTFDYAIIDNKGTDTRADDENICWATVTAEDKTAPEVTPPADKYLECWLLDDVLNNAGTVADNTDNQFSFDGIGDGPDGNPINDLGIPTWIDCSDASFTWSDAVRYYQCDYPLGRQNDRNITAVITRRFTVTDAYGNSSTATQDIYFISPNTNVDENEDIASCEDWGWDRQIDEFDSNGDGVKFYFDRDSRKARRRTRCGDSDQGEWIYMVQTCDADAVTVPELFPYYTGQLNCETGEFDETGSINGVDYYDSFFNRISLDEIQCNLSTLTEGRRFDDVCSDGSYKMERKLNIFDWCETDSDTEFEYVVKVGDFTPPILDNCVFNPLDVPGVRRRTNFGDAETVIELLNGDTDGDGDLENDQIRPEHIEAGQITFFDDEDEELKEEGYTVSVCLEMVSTGPMDCTASLNTDLGALRALWGRQLVQDCEDPTVTSEIYSYSEVYVGGFPTGEYAWQIGGYSMVGTMAVGIPEGLHALVFSATDNCYNSTLGMIFFTVMDGTKPVMKCDDELRVTLVDGDPKLQIQGYALATAQDVDEGSWDNCGPVDLHVRRIINDADVQADWEAKNGRLLIDEYEEEDPDYNQGYTGWDDLVEFFCGDLDEKVTVELRGSDTKKIWRKCIENCGGSTSDDVYIYSIFRKTQEQQDDGWVHVKTPNQSVCWLEVEVENGTNYTVELDGGGTALCTDDFNADDFITVTYLGLQCASPDIEVVVEPELDQCGIGRYKIYLQDNTDVESKNRPNVDPNPVYVYVRPYHDYWIKFPKDAIYDCGADQEVGGVETSADLEVGCDLLAISTLPDETFAATSDPDACYKIFRTYRVINWCEYDGQQEPVVVSRDWDRWNGFDFGTSTTSDDRDPNARREYNINPQFPDGDDNPGNTDLYVIVKRNLNDDLVDRVFYDADSDPTANVGEVSTDQPRFGSNGSGNTDVETYWWQVTSGSRGIVDLAPAGNSSNDYFGDTEANEPDWDLDTNNESYYDGSYRGEPVRWGYDPNVSNADPNGSANDSSDNDDDDQYYGSVGFWQYTQHIIVYDDTAPEVRVEAEETCSINGETCDAETSFDIVITDVCSLDDITLKVYVNGEAATATLTDADTAVIATVTGRRGLGNYKISGEVNDGCGNITPFDGELEVVDCKAPAPICQNGMVVELMPADAGGQQGDVTDLSAGMASVWAKDLIASPVGDCSGQGPEEVLVGNGIYLPMITKYSINRLDSAVADSLTSLVVTCADEGLMVEVEIHAWDELGNHDFCRTSIIVQDNNGACNLSGATGNIAGVIETEQAAKLEGVEVQLSGAQSRMYMTGQLGDYGFDNLTEGHDFSVIPTKDDDHKNGISTFDLILIQKHILGIAPLESPYQLIAADANNSKSVSTLDLIQIRKLILNIDTELANNTSWRFVDADYTFPNEGNPWQEAFPEIRNINNLEGEQIVNFIAVKVGDVNNSANVEARSKQGMFVINTKEQVMTRGNEYTIEFTADLAKIAGYQFTLDVKQAEIVDIIYGAASAEHFGVFPKEGIITTSFNGEAPTENANGILFSVVLRANADVKVSEAIGISSRYTASEAYADLNSQHDTNGQYNPLSVALNFDGQTETSGEFVLNQNTPNPFEGETVISFNLPQAAEATITLKDVAGRTIKVIEGDFTKGYSEVRVKSNELPTTGVFFYTLTVGELTATKKMIITE